ncbi:PREDICTED: uncharacterized protein LOC101308376 [Fragaria vesca subsp. vesca]|uniref:uncharacterized protein LOC101308376 n=1 Tax=Fragaria vesca subsp. vesca TaxID=101020 RepID=UPI0002C32EA7|nr:PREDICTED: uncharacterized protein LOC101308376 [Fragaria vesca subsp. vesca]
MALVTHQMQGSFVTYPSRPLSWSKGMKLKRYVTTLHMVGRTESCSIMKHNICLSVGASPICGPKLKPLRVSAFKGSAQNDKSGGRKSGSKLPKNSVKIKENEDTTVGPPQANDIPLSYASEANESITSSPAIHNLFKKWLRMLRTQSSGEVVDGILAEDPPPKEISETEHKTQNEDRDGILRIIWCNFLSLNATIKIPLLIFVPSYLAVNILYGAEVSKELTPLWVLGPFIAALYIKMLQWLCALYIFSFKQTVKVVTNLPTYYLAAYRYIFHGKFKEDIYARFWQPVVDIKNLDYKKLSRRKLKVLQELIVEKYLDFVESIWPYYCRAIRFLKRANLI